MNSIQGVSDPNVVNITNPSSEQTTIATVTNQDNVIENNSKGDLSSIRDDLDKVSSQYNEIESLIITKDTSMNSSIKDLLSSLKTISHNQTVLENRLEDALKNQVNTDILVNSLNERLNNLSKQVLNISASNVSYSNISNNDMHYSTHSAPAKRGPGRPRKESSSSNFFNNTTNILPIENPGLNPVKVQLPTGSVHLSKSKRYFVDPSSVPSSNVNTAPSSASSSNQLPQRKRRGRPPKKRTVDTVIINGEGAQSLSSSSVLDMGNENNINNDDDENVEDVKELSTLPSSPSKFGDDSEDNDSEDSKDDNSNLDIKDDDELDEDMDSQDEDEDDVEDKENQDEENQDEENQTQENSFEGSSQSKSKKSAGFSSEVSRQQRELDKLRDPREKMLVNMKYNDRDKAKSFMRSNQKLLIAMKEDERRRRMTAVVVNVKDDNKDSIRSKDIENENTLPKIEPNVSQQGDDLSNDQPELYQLSVEANEKDDEKTNESMVEASSRKFGISSILNSDESATPSEIVHIFPSSTDNKDLTNLVTNTRKRARSDSLTFKEPNGRVILISGTNPIIDPLNPRDDGSMRSVRKKKLLSSPPVSCNPITTSTVTTMSAPGGVGGYSMTSVIPLVNHNVEKKGVLDIDSSTIHRNAINNTTATDYQTTLLLGSPIELVCKDGFFYRRNAPQIPITTGAYLEFRFLTKEKDLKRTNEEDFKNKEKVNDFMVATLTKHDRTNTHFLKPDIDRETELAFDILSKTTLTEKYVNSLEYFLMEFRWENKLVGLGLKLRESKRTWQRRKALFALFEFWRDQSEEKRNFKEFTILHAVKEMENYRIFINRSVSWFYNHITLLKMILYDLCDNVDTQWREWMFPKDSKLPILGEVNDENIATTVENINEQVDNLLVFDFLDDGSENNQIKSSKVVVPRHH